TPQFDHGRVKLFSYRLQVREGCQKLDGSLHAYAHVIDETGKPCFLALIKPSDDKPAGCR
ncbi:MAG TPA: hypothetical protein VE870_10060, partial [Bacteroidales bacterium]|nr:hypothetical protein [Bacteroidales bacterium]